MPLGPRGGGPIGIRGVGEIHYPDGADHPEGGGLDEMATHS